MGKRLCSLAWLACGRALCLLTGLSGGVNGGILRLERIVGLVQSMTSVVVPLCLGREKAESSGLLLTALKTAVSRK